MFKPTYADVLTRLKQFVVEMTEGLSIDTIDDDEDIFECGYVDSLSSVDLLNTIEVEYGLRLPEETLGEGLSTLSSLARRITKS